MKKVLFVAAIALCAMGCCKKCEKSCQENCCQESCCTEACCAEAAEACCADSAAVEEVAEVVEEAVAE